MRRNEKLKLPVKFFSRHPFLISLKIRLFKFSLSFRRFFFALRPNLNKYKCSLLRNANFSNPNWNGPIMIPQITRTELVLNV